MQQYHVERCSRAETVSENSISMKLKRHDLYQTWIVTEDPYFPLPGSLAASSNTKQHNSLASVKPPSCFRPRFLAECILVPSPSGREVIWARKKIVQRFYNSILLSSKFSFDSQSMTLIGYIQLCHERGTKKSESSTGYSRKIQDESRQECEWPRAHLWRPKRADMTKIKNKICTTIFRKDPLLSRHQ